MSNFQITQQAQVRKAFREQYPHLDFRKVRNYAGTGKMHVTDTRVSFVDFVDYLQRDNQISTALANKVTL